jgi:hypothetical protein
VQEGGTVAPCPGIREQSDKEVERAPTAFIAHETPTNDARLPRLKPNASRRPRTRWEKSSGEG